MSVFNRKQFGSNNWCLKFDTLGGEKNGSTQSSDYLLTLLSSGIQVLHKQTLESVNSYTGTFGDSPLSCLASFHDGNTFAASSGKTIKIFDIRTDIQKESVATVESDHTVMSLTYDHETLAYGTELSGVDAPIHLFQNTNYKTPYRSFLDSHHDDVMSLQFHPTDRNILLSGSTDGYCNVYDLAQQEEDDSLHQVINYGSVHSCGFSSAKRIFVLTHMETFSIHSLNDKSDDLNEQEPLDLGDIRESWDTQYVVDVYPGFIACGKTSDNSLKLLAFDNEKICTAEPLLSIEDKSHGDVVRDVYVQNNMVYTCGEDGYVNLFKTKEPLNLPSTFWDYNKNDINQTNVFNGSVVEVDMDQNEDVTAETKETVEKKSKDSSDSHKSKKKKSKHKSKKHSSSKESSSSHRYRPY